MENESIYSINDAYFGKLGYDLQVKTREKIHWIASKVIGSNILDIGRPQSILQFVLFHEGKKVYKIDIEADLLSFSKFNIESDYDNNENLFRDEVNKIFNIKTKEKFDTIILTNIMEHFTNPNNLLNHIEQYINSTGRIIITVPFGYNEFNDNKQIYYLTNLVSDVEHNFQIVEISLIDLWIGIVAEKAKIHTSFPIQNLLNNLEINFSKIEKFYISKLDLHKRNISILENQKTELQEINNNLNSKNIYYEEELKNNLQQVNQLKDELLKRLNNEKELLTKMKEIVEQYQKLEIDRNIIRDDLNKIKSNEQWLKNEQIKYKNDLMKIKSSEQWFHNERDILRKKLSESENNNREILTKLRAANTKYNILASSKLGRLTLKKWQITGKYKKWLNKKNIK